MSDIRVSILMTVYNALPYLQEAVESLLSQTYQNFELVIIENGSTDGSKKIIAAYDDPRIRIIDFDENIGRTPGLSRALQEAQGELVAVLDADDVSFPTRLEQQVAYFDQHQGAALVGGWCEYIDEKGQIISTFQPEFTSDELYQSLAHTNSIVHSGCMYRREMAVKAGGYPEQYAYAQDYGLWIKLAKMGSLEILPVVFCQQRQHAQSMSELPKFKAMRCHDAVTLYREAERLPNQTKDGIRLSRQKQAEQAILLGRLNVMSGQVLSGSYWLMWGFFRSPKHIISKVMKS